MSTLKTSNIQHGSASTAAITLASDSTATLNGLAYPTSGSLTGRNRIINGDMRIDQRNAGAANASTAYGVDRWYQEWSTTAVTLSWQQVNDAPVGFTSSLKVTVSTGNASFTNSAAIYQVVEGLNFSDLSFGTASAKSITISFWVKSSLTGAFGGVIRNADFSQNYPFSYTISAANTWEYKTVTIPGSTTGTWATDNTGAATLTFGLGAVSARKATANTWAASIARQPTGTVDLIATTGATLQITGVQLEAGTVATPFERRSYGQELSLCQRYFETITLQGSVNGALIFSCQSSTGAAGMVGFNVQKRSTPVYTIGAGGFSIQAGGNVPQGVTVVSAREPVTKGGVAITFNAGAAGSGSVVHQAATTGPLTADSEL